MKRTTKLFFVLVAVAALLALSFLPAAPAGEVWKQAIGPRVWSFPRDHGSHPDYRTEWWYFTGNLAAAGGNRYGYQLTFFRQGIRMHASSPDNPWSIRDVFLAHFALSDIGGNDFRFAEQASRSGPGLAGARRGGMDVRCLQWSARMMGRMTDRMDGRTIRLSARREGVDLNLSLTPRKPPVLHGEQGLSRKGPREGQASYYYSFTDLETKGTIRTRHAAADIPVTGTSWFDHEFGSNQLTREQVGWDWFSVHLSDGRDLMLYFLRRQDGSQEPTSSGTLVERSGRSRHLALADIRVRVLAHWKSPTSGGRYPSRWQIQIPSAAIDLTLTTLIADQEVHTGGSTGVVYYEGAAAGEGTSAGRAVRGEGYVEMTGYAGGGLEGIL